MKVKAVIREYTNNRRFLSLADATKRMYIRALDTLDANLGDQEIADVRRRDLIKIVDSLYDKPGIASHFVKVVSLFFNYAHDMEYVNGSPAHRLGKPDLGSWDRWEEDDVWKAIRLGDGFLSAAVALAYFTGQRQSDILSIKWRDIDGDYINIVQQKTKAVLKIKLSPKLKRILSSIEPAGEYIVSLDGKKMTGAAFRAVFKRRTRALKIERTFHGLRKTVGAKLAENGRSVNEIAAMLGHKTLAMAALYTRQANNTKLISSAVDSLG